MTTRRGRSKRASCGGPGSRPAPKSIGPAVIEERNSTTFVPPGDRAVIDACGNIVITLGERA